MSHSTAWLERNLAAFHWLKLDQWTPETIFNNYKVNSKQMCKICDEWASPADLTQHVKKHVEQEKARRERIREEEAEAKKIAREEERAAERAVRGLPPKKNTNERKVKMTDSITSPSEGSNISNQVSDIFSDGNEHTLVSLSAATGQDVSEIRPIVKTLADKGDIVVSGKVTTGKRGRPALIYKKS